AVMETPAFRSFRRGFPHATIAGVIKTRVTPTLDGTPWFDEWIRFDPHSRVRAERTMPVVQRLRRGRFDMAVLLPNSFRSALIAWLAGIPRRVGCLRHGPAILLVGAVC